MPIAFPAAHRSALVARLRRRGWASGLALGSYALISFLYFGLRALGHPGRTYIGTPNGDAQLEIWAFAWWPHAILNGENPFYTHAIWAPSGVELAWPTMAPGLALAFAPLTYLLGPVGSFDVCAVLMPALSAWTAFLLCRYVTRSFWASLAGGYIFGFSAYELGSVQAHPAHRRLPRAARRARHPPLPRGCAEPPRAGAAARCPRRASAHDLDGDRFTLALALVCSLLLAYLLVPGARSRLRSVPVPLAGAYAVGAVLTSPLAYYLLVNFVRRPFNPISPTEWSADLLNAVVPTDILAAAPGGLHAISRHFTGFESEQGAYYGLPALVDRRLVRRAAVANRGRSVPPRRDRLSASFSPSGHGSHVADAR